MAVRSTRLAGPTLCAVTGGVTTLYTVPAGRTAVRLVLVLFNQVNATAGANYVLLNGSSGASGLAHDPLTAFARKTYDEQWVMNPGDVLDIFTTTANQIVATLFGSLLLGEPE